MIAEHVGKALQGCSWVGIPFCGGLSEVPHIDARTIVCNDLHKHILNLARVAADPRLGPALYRRLRRLILHPQTLAYAQGVCREIGSIPTESEMLDWAENYFVCAWMARNGTAGTKNEFKAGLSFRWEAGGGDSATRYRNAVGSLLAWRRTLARCTFTCLDVFEFLKNCKDETGLGLYADAPWPSDGDCYAHKFSEADQRQLATKLSAYCRTRVVVRFGVHPLIRELYPESAWDWRRVSGRTSANNPKAEVLLVRNAPPG